MARLLGAAAALLPVLSAASWYDGLEGVKVLSPGADNWRIMDEIFQLQQEQFNERRYAVLLKPGDYGDFNFSVGYYTGVYGVAADPGMVRLARVESHNTEEGGAAMNNWRSLEGVTLTGSVTWAVSQAAPLRRDIFEGELSLSEDMGWASGGFMADSRVQGELDMGSQQQWFFRNVDLSGITCPSGWNFVFMGQWGLSQEALDACRGASPGKVAVVQHTPRIAEKPYLVLEGTDTWRIYVPEHRSNPIGANGFSSDISAPQLDLETEVFIAKPHHTAVEINKGIRGKKGLLVTPGVYRLAVPINVQADGFVVLGIGFPTLIAVRGLSAIQVDDGLEDVRIAGVLLEAGTPQELRFRKIKWGKCAGVGHHPISDVETCEAAARDLGFPHMEAQVTHMSGRPEGCYQFETGGRIMLFLSNNTENRGKGAETSARGIGKFRSPLCMLQVGSATHPLLSWGTGALRDVAEHRQKRPGVISDVFARVGSFAYQGCNYLRADTMVEINSDDVILDNTWLWHADHDDCQQKSDGCHSVHGLVVNGHRVTSYGMSAEHTVAGDVVSWNGEDGETYFFQGELPYNTPAFGTLELTGYAVGQHVASHVAVGVGVYIVGPAMTVKSAIVIPPTTRAQNLFTVVLGKTPQQFQHTACTRKGVGSGWDCYVPQHCDWMRCVLEGVPEGPSAKKFLV